MRVVRSAMSAPLRQPGHARLEAMPLPIALVHFPIEAVAGLGGSGMGARADDAHVAAQHVEKLRQLIDAGLAQETAYSRHPVVVPRRQPVGLPVARLRPHGPELVDAERPGVAADARLAEADLAGAGQLHRQGRAARSAERRVGTACVSTFRSRRSPYPYKHTDRVTPLTLHIPTSRDHTINTN